METFHEEQVTHVYAAGGVHRFLSSFAVWVVLACVAGYAFESLARTGSGHLEQVVWRGGKGAHYEVFVRDENGRRFRLQGQVGEVRHAAAGTVVHKSPGNFEIRSMPAGTQLPVAAEWFRFGHGDLLQVLGMLAVGVVLAGAWTSLVCSRVTFDREARQVRVEMPVWPGRWMRRSERALDGLTGFSSALEVVNKAHVWTVQAHVDGVAVTLGHAPSPEAAAALIAELEPWLKRPATAMRATAQAVAAGAVGICQVCGTDAPLAWVRCERCETPHHRDCWNYNGACSTFACRG